MLRLLPFLLALSACASDPVPESKDPDFPSDTELPDTVDTDVVDTADTDVEDTAVFDTDLPEPPTPMACIGTLDTRFDGDGLASFYAPEATYDATAWSVAVDAEDRVLLGGRSLGAHGRTASLMRMRSDGSIDPDFGSNGWRTDLFTTPSIIKSLVVLPDGKILAAGDVDGEAALMRFLPDGAWDLDFSGDGWLTHVGMTDDADAFETMLADGDGAILAGDVGGVPTLVRYDGDGNLDTTWAGGAAAVNMGTDATLLTLARTPDGAILVGGEAGGDISIARVAGDGTQDVSFGDQGSVRIDVRGDDRISGLAVDDAGRIVGSGTMGFTQGYGDDADWVVVRLLPEGTLDPSFGGDGVVELDIDATLTPGPGDQDRARDILPLPTGELLILGQTKWNSWAGRMVVARLTADGTPDPCFGTDGFLPLDGFDVAQQGDTPGGMAWSANGEEVVVGGALNPSAAGWNGAARLLP